MVGHSMYVFALLLFQSVTLLDSSMLEFLSCGMDSSAKTVVGKAPLNRYPWLGILYYVYDGNGDERATTMAIMIRNNYAIVPSFDVSNIPRATLRTNTRVVFGIGWISDDVGLRVESYTLHPEYDLQSLNTMALVKFEEGIRADAWPVCPPITSHHRNDTLYSVIIEDIKALNKIVRKMVLVNKGSCLEFYRKNNLLFRRMQPVQYVCAVAASESTACVQDGGSALVSRDPWGRWRLIGFGVRGPGCGAPSQYLDVFHYLPWLEKTISSDEYITVLRTAPNQLYLRPSLNDDWLTAAEKITKNTFKEYNQLGNCFDTTVESVDLYREDSLLQCDAMRAVQGKYRLMITQIVNVMCVSITTQGVHGASPPFLWIEHHCDRTLDLCHIYRNSTSSLEISFLFSFRMRLKVLFTGQQVPLERDDEMVKLPNYNTTRMAEGLRREEVKSKESRMSGHI